MKSEFSIQQQAFSIELNTQTGGGFSVRSSPRPYTVGFGNSSPRAALERLMHPHKQPLLLIDERVEELYGLGGLADPALRFKVAATEDKKNIGTVLKIIEFLEARRATRASMLFVVGGGIIQDLGAFAAYLYKRGIPWTLVPTTLLSQGDSGIGGKTALNHHATKNLLGLFSAPRHVQIETGFLEHLPRPDLLSGAGEILRLCATGGPVALALYEKDLPGFLAGDEQATARLISVSLQVKTAVIEFDEFELDLRRSLNYGHSFGHALEALTEFRIPHGVGVTIGMLVENEISHQRGLLSGADRDQVIRLAAPIISDEVRSEFARAPLVGLLDLLQKDKKSEGAVLKVATLVAIGEMKFIDLPLNASGQAEVESAVRRIVAALGR
jgi:3-dehydroquinate synthase